MEWLAENWQYLIVVLAAVIIVAYFIIKKILTDGLRQTAIDLITYVEKHFYGEAGSKKFEEVFNRLYSCLPAYVKMFLSETAAKALIQAAFDSIKEALHYTPGAVAIEEVIEIDNKDK